MDRSTKKSKRHISYLKGNKMDKEERIFWAWAEACDKMAEEQAREEGRVNDEE